MRSDLSKLLLRKFPPSTLLKLVNDRRIEAIADNAGRNTTDDGIGRDIVSNDCATGNDRAIAHSDTSLYLSSMAYPDIMAYDSLWMGWKRMVSKTLAVTTVSDVLEHR